MSDQPRSPDEGLTDVHDMYVVHRAFRREFTLIPQLIRAVAPGDVSRASVVAAHARRVLTGLHLHHSGEDALLWPTLLERAQPSADVVHRMERQHHRVEELVAPMEALLSRWEAEALPADGEALAGAVEDLREALLEHLEDEEVHILPLAARHMSKTEWAALGQHGISQVDKALLPILFGSMLEDATPEERTSMLSTIPLPARVLVRTLGAWQYRRYITSVRGH